MLLTVDVGNTHTVLGTFEADELTAHWRLATASGATEDEMWVMLRALLHDKGVSPADITDVVIGSVVPPMTDALFEVCTRYLGREPLLVDGTLDIGMPVRVQPPTAAGADRLANAVAALARYGAPCIVVDLGTATTFDVVDAGGAYVGGIIAPGVYTASEDLFRRAARLAKIEILPPDQVVGSTTEQSLRSGLYLGTLAQIDGLIALVRGEVGEEAAVVFTGGLSTPFREAFAERGTLDPFLTLEGLRLIHGRVRG